MNKHRPMKTLAMAVTATHQKTVILCKAFVNVSIGASPSALIFAGMDEGHRVSIYFGQT